MYHIKEDRRSQASAAALVSGLQECLKAKPLKSITVTDLHKVTGISRATFYRLFDTPEDVLVYQLDQMNGQIYAYYTSQWEATPETLLEEAISVGMYYHDFIRAMVENGRFDLLYQYTEKNFRLLDEIKSVFPENLTAKERDYIISYLSMTMVASLITWNHNDQRDSPRDIVHFLKSYIQIAAGMVDHP